MYVVVTDSGKVVGPFLTLEKARDEKIYSGGHIYLLQGPITK